MKKLAATLLTVMAMAVVPVAIAPVAQAEICPGPHGTRFSVGACTNVAGGLASQASIPASHIPYYPGETPCHTVEGVPYFTPPGFPC
jgi:hypothetical protein